MATYWRASQTRDHRKQESSIVEPANGRDFTLKELQNFVGGYIEIVRLDAETVMVVNEDGHALDLEFNAMGTMLYDDMSKRNGHGPSGHAVVGDMLVCRRGEID